MELPVQVEKGNILQFYWTADGSTLASESRLSWSRLTGQQEELERPWGWLMAVYVENHEQIQRVWREAVSSATMFTIRYRLQTLEKLKQDVIMRCVPLLREEEQLEGWVSWIWIEDLAFQRQLEQERAALLSREQIKITQAALQQSQQEAAALGSTLHAVFCTAMDGIIIYDAEGKVLQINEAACLLLEFGAKEQCLGKPFVELAREHKFYRVHDDTVQRISMKQIPLIHMLKGKIGSTNRTLNRLVRLPSGRECYLDITLTPLFDQQGCLTSIVAILRDVTALCNQERRIRKAFHTLSHVMDAMIALPLRTNQHMTEESTATTTLMGVGQRLCEVLKQMLDCTAVSMVVVEGAEARMQLAGNSGGRQSIARQIQQDMQDATLFDYLDETSIEQLRTRRIVIRDLRTQPFVRRPSYGIRNFLLAPMLLEGQLIGIISIDRPHKQRYTREEIMLVKALAHMAALMLERVNLLHAWAQAHANELTLQETNHRFDAFLSLASHELRTPLTGIRGNIQLVLRRMQTLVGQEAQPHLTGSTQQRLRQPLQEAVQRAVVQDRMISDLLDVSRIRADRLEMSLCPANLRNIVHQAVQDIRYLATERKIKLYEPAEKMIAVTVDADRIGQVVNNYLTNALKYSAPDQPVEIRLTKENQVARVSVRDQGPGLTAQEQQEIWERFHRVKGIEVQYGAGGGLGLGLYLCHTIIERHEGQIGVHSCKGDGSTFWFTLPLACDHSSYLP
ncbi:hypothetical protein KDH_76710 [Dictyobacter sp. S3.2.2.5]|uniref:histidine kinase n=1 Tax=Dictyobacter halimunensis TaxID=3026934 RepID=A0ABQ6G6D2_9CHLR|nr:hypothetical protein KDH_76710 [Dictyobacter sp. S3.2.2.5]